MFWILLAGSPSLLFLSEVCALNFKLFAMSTRVTAVTFRSLDVTGVAGLSDSDLFVLFCVHVGAIW